MFWFPVFLFFFFLFWGTSILLAAPAAVLEASICRQIERFIILYLPYRKIAADFGVCVRFYQLYQRQINRFFW